MDLQELLSPLSLNQRELSMVQEQINGVSTPGQVEAMIKELRASDTMKVSNQHHKSAVGLNLALNALRSELSNTDTPEPVTRYPDGSSFDPNVEATAESIAKNKELHFGAEGNERFQARQKAMNDEFSKWDDPDDLPPAA